MHLQRRPRHLACAETGDSLGAGAPRWMERAAPARWIASRLLSPSLWATVLPELCGCVECG